MTHDTTIAPVLHAQDLRVSFGRPQHDVEVVRGVDLRVDRGQCLAVVGESGSGKSVTARALIGLAGAGSRTTASRLELNGTPLLGSSDRDWRRIRGAQVGFVLQDALVSLDPLRPVGREIGDALRLHTRLTASQRGVKVLDLLTAVGVPDAANRARQRSGELSGGLRQRALIAAAIALAPPLLVADEPTTALDATVQLQILELLEELKAAGTAILLVSHDLAVVSRVADQVAVMKDGVFVEAGPVAQMLSDPQHPYTQRLLRAVPSGRGREVRLSDVPSRVGAAVLERRDVAPVHVDGPAGPVLEATGLRKAYRKPDGQTLQAVDDVAFSLPRGTTLGIVGESGSGKSTVARLALGLVAPDAGEVRLLGAPWSALTERHRRPVRRQVGIVHQDPLSSFDPRWTVGQVLTDALTDGARTRASAEPARVRELLDLVGLAASVADRRPRRLSGGQRQRVAIARTLAHKPEVVVCDEPVSALDVSVQAQVLDLLVDLQRELHLSYLFISHDLGVVHHMSDRVLVMKDGRVVEEGAADDLFAAPQHPYTRRLLAAVPRHRPISPVVPTVSGDPR